MEKMHLTLIILVLLLKCQLTQVNLHLFQININQFNSKIKHAIRANAVVVGACALQLALLMAWMVLRAIASL